MKEYKGNPRLSFAMLIIPVMLSFVFALCPADAFTVRQADAAIDNSGLVWGAVTEGLALGAESVPPANGSETETESVSATGRPVSLGTLRFVLWNATQDNLLVTQSYAESDYRLTVTGPQGEEIPVRPSRRNLPVWVQGVLLINPGEEIVDEYDLGKMYDLSEDGKYQVIARRFVFRLDGEGCDTVTSTPFTFVLEGGKLVQMSSSSTRILASKRPHRMETIPLVAARKLLEKCNYYITWDASKHSLIASTNNSTTVIIAGSRFISQGKQKTDMGREAKLIEGRLYMPGNALSLLTSMIQSKS